MMAFSLLFLALLLFCPEAAVQGSKYGSALWLNELLPTLLPFFITLRLFQLCLPKVASHPAFLLLGILCGYPTGASLVAQQYRQGLLSRKRAYFYLGFVNNPSPMFILAYCSISILHLTFHTALLFFFTILLAGFTGSLIVRFIMGFLPEGNKVCDRKNQTNASPLAASKDCRQSLSLRLDSIILESFILIAKIGGYVILFSILGQFLCLFISPSSISGILCLGSMEITSGVSYLKISALASGTKKILTAAILAFGGLSAAAQTSSVLSQSELSIFPYVLNKILNAGLAALLCTLLLLLL